MRRLFLHCLISLPILVHAETKENATIPAPPELSAPISAGAASTNAAETTTGNATAPLSDIPEPPDLPMPVQSGESLEPDITIIRRGEETIQEFRNNGVVYLVKVIPDLGPAYYLLDADGDGKFVRQENDLDKGAKVNMWKIFDWK
ncbi:MAG: DUF2782 domain-containing protein [Methylococcaceae bacterium]|nr:DUF2782 domain-containing protein [Methylococcaceae bacterium]